MKMHKGCFTLLYFGLVGCAMGPKCGPPATDVPCEWHSIPSTGMQPDSPECFNWWRALNDPSLNFLMEQASSRNPELQISALQANKQNTCDDYYRTWIILSANVAKNYVDLRGLQQRLKLISKNIGSQNETLRLTENLTDSGFTSSIDIKQAEEHLNDLAAQKPQIELSIHKTIHQLSILSGYAPGDLFDDLNEPRDLPTLPCQMPIGIPCEILYRRPDILKAERVLACGKSDLAYYEYQKTVLEALEEAENAIASMHYAMERTQQLANAQSSSRTAYQLIYQLYQRGLKDYPEVLAANRSLLTDEDAYLQGQVDLLYHYIELYKAIGSGWDVPEFQMNCVD